MPKLPGPFDIFDNLDQIDISSLISWLKSPPSPIQLENYLANKILYPQSIPISETDMKIDLAILREALRLNGPKLGEKEGSMLGDNPFLNITLRKIIIPQKFLLFFPDLVILTWAFVDGLLSKRVKKDFFEDLWTIVVSADTDEIVGSLIIPEFKSGKDILALSIMNKLYNIKPGSLTVIPCSKDRCEVSYKFSSGKILEKKEAALEVYGGKLGLIIDGRKE